MLYIHHVPGRLRLQTTQLKGNRLAAEAACDAAIGIPCVLEARVSAVTGSLIVSYNQQELTTAALWQSLCERGLASGPLPIRGGAVPRARIDPVAGAASRSIVELVRAT